MQKEFYDRENNIMQSKIWEEFCKSLGQETFWVQDSLLVKLPLVRDKSYLYCPKGAAWKIKDLPTLRSGSRTDVGKISSLKEKVLELTKGDSSIVFARIESAVEENQEIDFEKLGFITPKILTQQKSPEITLVLNLSKSEGDLLTQMKPKTRYNIRLAEKRGVTVRQSQDQKDVKIFYSFLEEMEARDKTFAAHSLDHYQKLLEVLAKNNAGALFIAEFDKKPLAAIIVSFYNQTATYLHGASSSEKKELMAPYLLQWEAIKEAKKRSCQFYDFWGIALREETSLAVIPNEVRNPGDSSAAPQNDRWVIDEKHSWSGISRFKMGFGGEVVQSPSTYDLPLNRFWYNGLGALNKLRKWIKVA